MTYNQAIDWLFKIPLSFNRNYDNYDLKLEPVYKFCSYVGNPQNDLKIIHIGGTNGKGSTSHITSAILQKHGRRIGIFSSPHLIDFRERIKINGDYIEKKFIKTFISRYRSFIIKNKISFFEISFIMSLCYFKKKKVDYAVIEVGLGGRLDATNICNPILSCVTNIGFDHKKFLGNTLKKIALEKAGIIKYKTPVVVGEKRKELKKLFKDISVKLSSPIIFTDSIRVNIKNQFNKANYQLHNIQAAKKIVEIIDDIKIDNHKILFAVDNFKSITNFIGRWQIIKDKPLVIVDSAHNYNAFKEVVSQLESTKKKIKMIFGTLNKIDQLRIIDILPKNFFYYFCEPKIDRFMPVEKIKFKANKNKLKFKIFKSSLSAYKEALNECDLDDLIFISGSSFIVSEILINNEKS